MMAKPMPRDRYLYAVQRPRCAASGKIAFMDKRDAQTCANGRPKQRRRYPGPGKLKVYHCPLCGSWHLTSK